MQKGSKGMFWIATRSEMVGDWQHAGDLYRFIEGQPWDVDMYDIDSSAGGPAAQWVKQERRQELVFIGPGLDIARLTMELDRCLLSDQEMLLKHHGPYGQAPSDAQILRAEREPWNWWRWSLGADRFPPFESACCRPGVECEEDKVGTGHDDHSEHKGAAHAVSTPVAFTEMQSTQSLEEQMDYLVAHGNARERALALDYISKAQELAEAGEL